MQIDGHTVSDPRQGMVAIISHCISPAVGMIRLADRDGEPNATRFLDAAIERAVDSLVAAGYVFAPVTEQATPSGD